MVQHNAKSDKIIVVIKTENTVDIQDFESNPSPNLVSMLVCHQSPDPCSEKFWRETGIKTKMASVCATTATKEQGTNAGPPISDPSIAADCHSNKTGDDKTDIDARTKRLKQKRNAMKNSRRARKAKAKEMQLMEKRAEVEKQIAAMISTVQADIQVVVEAEKRKSEQYLSLARKYYTMWKALNDERSASMNKQQMRERRKHSTYGVSFLFELLLDRPM